VFRHDGLTTVFNWNGYWIIDRTFCEYVLCSAVLNHAGRTISNKYERGNDKTSDLNPIYAFRSRDSRDFPIIRGKVHSKSFLIELPARKFAMSIMIRNKENNRRSYWARLSTDTPVSLPYFAICILSSIEPKNNTAETSFFLLGHYCIFLLRENSRVFRASWKFN
jgi:hypothetical protein